MKRTNSKNQNSASPSKYRTLGAKRQSKDFNNESFNDSQGQKTPFDTRRNLQQKGSLQKFSEDKSDNIDQTEKKRITIARTSKAFIDTKLLGAG